MVRLTAAMCGLSFAEVKKTIANANSQLALHGGEPVFPEGPPDWPLADDAIRDALHEVWSNGSWGKYHGPSCDRLTEELRQFHGVDHVLLCSSGTIAVEIALQGLKVTSGDEVILAGYDFGGNFRCIEDVGARPVLVDIDQATWSLDTAQIEAAFSAQTRAIIVSHLHGGLAPMRRIRELANEHQIMIVEDACQVPGAIVDGQKAGAWGDVGIMSFGGSKLLTAGRGGAVITPHADIAQRAKVFCERGNHAFPLSELQAAVLVPQLERLNERNALRLGNVRRLREQCAGVDGLQMVDDVDNERSPVYFKVAMLMKPELLGGKNRQQLIAALQAEGIAIDAGFRGFARRSAQRCRKVGDLMHSQNAAENTLVLHHPILLKDEQTIGRLAQAIKKVSTALKQ